MEDRYLIQPDTGFVKEVIERGGEGSRVRRDQDPVADENSEAEQHSRYQAPPGHGAPQNTACNPAELGRLCNAHRLSPRPRTRRDRANPLNLPGMAPAAPRNMFKFQGPRSPAAGAPGTEDGGKPLAMNALHMRFAAIAGGILLLGFFILSGGSLGSPEVIQIDFGMYPEVFEGAEVEIDGKVVGTLERTGQATRAGFKVEEGKHVVRVLHEHESAPVAVTLRALYRRGLVQVGGLHRLC